MAIIPLGLGDWSSETQDIPRSKLHNMYVSANPTTPDGFSRVSRPTLTEFTTVGAGPIRGMWRQVNTFDSDWLVVSGEELYRVNSSTKAATLLGDIPGTGFCQFAGTDATVLIATDGVLYMTEGTAITLPDVPDGQPVGSVAMINSYFLLSILDTQKFYWIEPFETVIDPLDFASAERIPDPIVSINIISDEVWFVGTSGPEVWTNTGDADAPFQRLSARVYNEGCFARDTVVSTTIEGLPSLMWVTDTKAVVISTGSPKKVSNESVEELLKTSDDLVAWVFRHNRHDFYLITSPLFTVVYDITSGLWMRWSSYLRDYWRSHVGLQDTSEVYAGDRVSNIIWHLEEGTDDGGDPVVREVSGFLPLVGKNAQCSKVEAYVNSGWSPTYGFIPTLELRWSEDLGNTWSDYVPLSLGDRGDYTANAIFRSLGLIKTPGRLFEFRISDKVRFRLDYAVMNGSAE